MIVNQRSFTHLSGDSYSKEIRFSAGRQIAKDMQVGPRDALRVSVSEREEAGKPELELTKPSPTPRRGSKEICSVAQLKYQNQTISS